MGMHAHRAPPGSRAALAVVVAALFLGAGLPDAASRDDVDTLLAQSRRELVNRHLHVRARAWLDLAATRDARAREILIEAYDRRKEEPQGRALLVSVVSDAFDRPEDVDALAAWRVAHDGSEHLWLWYRTLRAEIGAVGAEGALALARGEAPVWQRLAALAALAAWGTPEALSLVGAEGGPLPESEPSRSFVLEALSEVMASQGGRRRSQPMRRAVGWMIDQLERPETTARTRLVIVRALARVYDTPDVFLDPAYWRLVLETPDPPKGEHDYAAPPTSRFLEMAGTGDRVLYVIDASGSMRDPLTEEERRELRGLGPPPGRSEAEGLVLEWERIQTRMDAAIECAKHSILHLPPSSSFCIVLFGAESRLLPATPNLVEATPERVARAVKDLERMRVGGLLGDTNLHGALRLALGISDRTASEAGDPLVELVRGPTTLFLLTDGMPTADDWSVRGPAARGANPYRGTYADPAQLLDDVERMNLLLRCEIHCVGIGAELAPTRPTGSPPELVKYVGAAFPELGPGRLLRDLATLGRGDCRFVPTRAAPSATPPRLARDAGSDDEIRLALRTLRTGPTPFARGRAIQILVGYRELEAVEPLIEQLTSPDAETRRDARWALEVLGGIAWEPSLDRRHDQARLARNWTWWWEQNEKRLLPPR